MSSLESRCLVYMYTFSTVFFFKFHQSKNELNAQLNETSVAPNHCFAHSWFGRRRP